MDIMLHLGAHGTASTTFQGFVTANQAALAHHGVAAWTPRRTRDGLMGGLVRHPERITLKDDERGLRSVGRMRIQLDHAARSGTTDFIIAEPNMIGTALDNLAEHRLYPLMQERLRRFAPVFDGHNLKIGIGIRSYEDFWATLLATEMRRGRRAPNMETLDLLTTQPRRWRFLVREIKELFPSATVLVWPYERLAGKPDSTLRALLGRDIGPLEAQDLWLNRSLDYAGLDLLARDKGQNGRRNSKKSPDAWWMPFYEDQRGVLRAEYRQDIAWLQSGAEGLATYIDGRDTSTSPPDRATGTSSGVPLNVVTARGHDNGIQKGLG